MIHNLFSFPRLAQQWSPFHTRAGWFLCWEQLTTKWLNIYEEQFITYYVYVWGTYHWTGLWLYSNCTPTLRFHFRSYSDIFSRTSMISGNPFFEDKVILKLQIILTDNINIEVFSGVINSRFFGFVQYESYFAKEQERKRTLTASFLQCFSLVR